MIEMPDAPEAQPEPTPADPLELVQIALNRLRFGAIQLVIHEGTLVQIDITEKHRFV